MQQKDPPVKILIIHISMLNSRAGSVRHTLLIWPNYVNWRIVFQCETKSSSSIGAGITHFICVQTCLHSGLLLPHLGVIGTIKHLWGAGLQWDQETSLSPWNLVGALQLWDMGDWEFTTVMQCDRHRWFFFSVNICFMVKVLLRMSNFKDLSLTIDYQWYSWSCQQRCQNWLVAASALCAVAPPGLVVSSNPGPNWISSEAAWSPSCHAALPEILITVVNRAAKLGILHPPWALDRQPSCENHFQSAINWHGMAIQLNCSVSKNVN